MKNYFESGNGHEKGKMGSRWLTDISESVNKTYQKQMDMSRDIYNQLIGVPFSAERTNLNEESFTANMYKSSVNLFQKNMGIYSDLISKLTSSSNDTFFKEKDMEKISERMYDDYVKIYEIQIKQLKEFSKHYLDAIEKNKGEMSEESSDIIDSLKNNIDENLDSSLRAVKIVLKPNNKRLAEDINKEMENVVKSNLSFWSDLIISMGKLAKEERKNGEERKVKETKKAPAPAAHKK